MVFIIGSGLAVTARHLLKSEPPNPFAPIAAVIHETGGTLVSYDLDYKQHPAGYFILRTTLSGDVRVLDGQQDVTRTLSMLRERTRGFLLTQRETELPEELRQMVSDPRTFDDFTLWERR